jgi:acetyl esterase/lipase
MSDKELQAVLDFLKNRPWPLAISERREVYDTLGDRFPLKPDVDVKTDTLGGVRVEWTFTPAARKDGLVVYLHGGGYVYGSLKSHRHLAAEIGRKVGLPSLAVDYRLAPEHPFPAALDDVLAVLQAMRETGTGLRNIVLAGDSAGGGLAVAVMLALRDRNLPLPRCAFLISPFTDMTAGGRSFEEKAAVDPGVKKETIEFVAKAYLNGTDPRHPLASPIFADLRGLPPLMIMVGSTEVLMDDSAQLARAAGAADIHVRFEIWPAMVHIWPTYYQMLSKGAEALEQGAAFIRSHLD